MMGRIVKNLRLFAYQCSDGGIAANSVAANPAPDASFLYN
jgi:hypothetical protein